MSVTGSYEISLAQMIQECRTEKEKEELRKGIDELLFGESDDLGQEMVERGMISAEYNRAIDRAFAHEIEEEKLLAASFKRK